MKTKRFNDVAYVQAYYNKGEYPIIHKDIAKVIGSHASENEPCIDIGACTSLLSIQAVSLGRSLCVAVEGSRKFAEDAATHPQVVQERLLITQMHLPKFEALLVKYKPTLLIARRVIPELADRSLSLVHELSSLLWKHDVRKIVLEGRKPTKNATNLLPTADDEAKALSNYYNVTYTYKNVRLLIKNL